jgi:DGQHR domain-containing protein
MQLVAMQFHQNGKTMYYAALPVSLLLDEQKIRVDKYNAKTDTGYQRNTSSGRFRDFARYVGTARGISPSALLLNVRGEIGSFKTISGNMGILNMPDDAVMFIVDGQHRIDGYREAVSDPKYKMDQQFEVPAIIMRENEYEEAKQFIIINKTQKGVRPDLAERFISRMLRDETMAGMSNLPDALTRDMTWRPQATAIVDTLNRKMSDDEEQDFYENPWYLRIQLPNDPKANTIISQKAFEDSLKPILNNDSFGAYNTLEMSIILARYWKALRLMMPQAFEDPKNYVLQKTTGAFVFHKVLPRVMSLSTRSGGRFTITTVLDVLNTIAEYVNEPFWMVQGSAGLLGSGNKTVSMLAAKLLDALEATDQKQEIRERPFQI